MHPLKPEEKNYLEAEEFLVVFNFNIIRFKNSFAMYYAVILLQKFHLFKVHSSIVLYCLASSLQDSTERAVQINFYTSSLRNT